MRRRVGPADLGDIDVPLAGGRTTTHGTGRTLPALSAEITGLRMVTGSGEFLEISDGQNDDMLEGARVALGSLGVLTEIQMQLVPRYKLHRHVWFERHESLLGRADSLWQENRNFEFFYLPFSGQSMAITHNETDAADTPRKKDDDGSAVMQLKSVRDYFSWFPALRKHLLARALSRAREENVIGESWQLLSTDRNVLFNEMEYHLPVNEGLEALEEVRRFIEKKRPDIFFPFEARRTSGDTAWLSPFQGEERISVAVHCYAEDAFEFLFTDIEPIFLRRGGRPHWGKLNRLDFATAQSLYPDFDRFRDLRHHLDPNGVMLNPYRNLFRVPDDGRIKGDVGRAKPGDASLFCGLQSALAKSIWPNRCWCWTNNASTAISRGCATACRAIWPIALSPNLYLACRYCSILPSAPRLTG